jgi:hypothetical protein
VIEKIELLFKGLIPMAILFFALWGKKVSDQSKRNKVNEIDLAAKKISFDNSTKPIDDLVAESNKSHGSTEMVKPKGNGSKG